MTHKELNNILKEHKLWLFSDGEKGKQADLSHLDLCGFDLSGANLKCANLLAVDLSGADLIDADLSEADLWAADLSNADLSNTNLDGANLSYANLSDANLSGADLSSANLSKANLWGADLKGADLNWANLSETNLDIDERIRKGLILQEKMTGWKKCQDDILVKLEIPKGATVFSINNDKCRTNKAKVIEIIGSNDNTAISQQDKNFVYKLGETVEIKNFNCQYNIECATGIHFFRTKEEAERY